jgi:hypothetical protein
MGADWSRRRTGCETADFGLLFAALYVEPPIGSSPTG